MNTAHPTRCTRKCWDAAHEKCTCGCGGKNHGVKRTQLDLFGDENMSWFSTLLGGAPEDEDSAFFIYHDAGTAAIISDGASYLETRCTETWITEEMHHVA